MTDKEIIKALNGADGLEHISVYCADNNGENVTSIKMVDIINLLNRLKTESLKYRYKAQIQKGELARLNKLVAEQRVEIERLQQNLKKAHIDIQEHQYEMKRAIAEGVRLLGLHLLDKSKNGRIKSSEIVDGVYEVLDELS